MWPRATTLLLAAGPLGLVQVGAHLVDDLPAGSRSAGEALSSDMDSIAAMISCGPTDEKGRRGVACNEQHEHDCPTMPQLVHHCPKNCPYVVSHPDLSCVFECTSRDFCSRTNPEFAFPNNVSYVCEPCNVVGCQTCNSSSTCERPFPNFNCGLGGVCSYVWDDRVKDFSPPVAAIALAAVLFISVLIKVVDSCCGRVLPQEDVPESSATADIDEAPGTPLGGAALQDATLLGGLELETDPTLRAINQGKRHRLRVKIRDLDVTPDDTAATISDLRQVPFWANLQGRFLAGVGLPLFHQWYYFLFLYSALMCAGTAYVFYSSELNSVLTKTGLDHVSHVLLERDRNSLCNFHTHRANLGNAMNTFASRSSIGYFFLWLLGLCLSLAHAAKQKRIAAEFYRSHQCLAEFALNIEGFPPEATDEGKILSYLRDVIGSEAMEVSVCYDYRDKVKRVHELLEKVLVSEDVKAGTYDASLTGYPALGLTEAEKEEVRGWLRPGAPDGLRNAGSVFAILPHNYDLQLARQKFDGAYGSSSSRYHRNLQRPRPSPQKSAPPILPHQATPEWLPGPTSGPLRWIGDNGRMHQLDIRDVVCEPPDVVWEHLGMRKQERGCRLAAGAAVILLSFATMASVVFVPLAWYTINFVFQAGSWPTGLMMTLLGILVMSGNWLMCILHIAVSSRLGYPRRDREALLIFKVFAALILVSNLFNISIAIWPQSRNSSFSFLFSEDNSFFFFKPLAVSQDGNSMREYITSMQDISFQVQASVHLFHVLVPGVLFIGYLMWPLQGFVWPFVSTLTRLRWWHQHSFVQDLTVRVAEKDLEPLGMSLGHDYMGHIVQPVSCSLILFFASGVVWQTFGCLAVWSLFMIPFQRYLHLRCVRRCYATTNRTDTEALFWWGVPLSMVLAASCFWTARLRGWTMWVVPLAWLLSAVLYGTLLTLCIRPLSMPKDEGHACFRLSYDEVRARRFYDWHNCNPIKVLLSHCREPDESEAGSSSEGREPIVPFEIGKEYLQVNGTWAKRMAVRGRAVEPLGDPGGRASGEDGEELQQGCFNCSFPGVPEVETLIQHPLDALGAISSRMGAGSRNGGRKALPRPTRAAHGSPLSRASESAAATPRDPLDVSRVYPHEDQSEGEGVSIVSNGAYLS